MVFDKPNHKIYIRHDANTTNQEPDLLLSVDNGLGLIGEYEYENLLASNNYQKLGSTASLNWGNGSPVFNSDGNFSAVTKYTQTNGIDGNGNTLNAITEFEYKGMRHQAGGRGSLGFSQITEIDVTNKNKTIKEYLQNYPYNGKLKKTTVQALTSYSGYATILTSEVTAWNLHTFLIISKILKYQTKKAI